jgi:hypothetical protein
LAIMIQIPVQHLDLPMSRSLPWPTIQKCRCLVRIKPANGKGDCPTRTPSFLFSSASCSSKSHVGFELLHW